MTSRNVFFLAWAVFVLVIGGGMPLLSQEVQSAQPPAPDKILGTWSLEINAESEYYYVDVILALTGNVLSGTVSDPSGTFTDVPLSDVAFDGATLKFGFSAPTPPDGLERAISVELKVGDDKTMEGTLVVPDLNVAATVKATKQ
jgi:hypothetical protein